MITQTPYPSADASSAIPQAPSARGNVFGSDLTAGPFASGLLLAAVNDEAMCDDTLMLQGHYGILLISRDGSYVYEVDPDCQYLAANESFTYTVLNPQTGERAQATLTMTLSPPPVTIGEALSIDGDGCTIIGGQTVRSYDDPILSSVLAAEDGEHRVVGVGSQQVDTPVDGLYGRLQMDVYGHFSYTPYRPEPPEEAIVESFTYHLLSFDKVASTRTLYVTVVPPADADLLPARGHGNHMNDGLAEPADIEFHTLAYRSLVEHSPRLQLGDLIAPEEIPLFASSSSQPEHRSQPEAHSPPSVADPIAMLHEPSFDLNKWLEQSQKPPE